MQYAQQVINEVRKAIVGKDRTLLWVLATILARGHILLEDIPAWGKPPWLWPFPEPWICTMDGFNLLRTCCPQT